MSNIIDSIQLSGTIYTLSAQTSGGGVPESTFSAYTAATDSRIAEDEEVTAARLNALNDRLSEDEEVTAAALNALNESLSGKQDTLVSGTNIKTINNESILGSGNIDIQGGGKAIEAGRGIAITTGETADTVSFNLPISAGTGNYSIIEGYSTSAMSYCDHAEGYFTYAKGSGYAAHAEGYQTSAMTYSSHAEGRLTKASGEGSHAEGKQTTASGDISHAEGSSTQANSSFSHAEGSYTTASSVSNVSGIDTYMGHQARHAEGCNTLANNSSTHTEGYYTVANNFGEHASGVFNNSASATTTWGDSGNTLFSVGNGTSSSARHNAFEIRQNGDIYITSGSTDIKLQDNLGGGSSINVVQTTGTSTTDVMSQDAVTSVLSEKVNISDNNVSAFSDFKVALESGKDYTSDNISTFYLGTNNANGTSKDLVTITTTDANYPTITINCSYSNGNITQVRTTSGITSSVGNGVAQITLTGGTLATVVSTFSGGVVFLYKQYTSGQTADVVEDTVYDALKELSNNKLDYIYKNETINSQKTFLWGSNDKPIIFKQSNNEAKVGFAIKNSASTNNELATFEFRPNTYTDSSSVKHPLLYFGHYRSTAIANAGVPQTMVGFRQYDQKGAAAYHYLIPLPAEAKTPFSLTASFKNYFAPIGFKNGSTMITTDNTGVADFSDVLGGLKLVKLTQSEYDLLATKDDNTVYFIGDSTNGYTMKIGSANVN